MSSELQLQTRTLEEIFNDNELIVYNQYIANSLDPALSKTKRKDQKTTARRKLKMALKRGRKDIFLSIDDLSASNIAKVFNDKELAVYNQYVANSFDTTLSVKQQTMHRSNARTKLQTAILKWKRAEGDEDATRVLDKKRKSATEYVTNERRILKEDVAAGNADAIAKNDKMLQARRDSYTSSREYAKAKLMEENAPFLETSDSDEFTEFSYLPISESSDSLGFTEFGKGDANHTDDVKTKVETILNSLVGSHLQNGSATTKKFIEEQGSMTLKELLLCQDTVSYIYYTRTRIIPGFEIKCVEATEFMVKALRNPLCRIDGLDENGHRDLRRFTRPEAKSVCFSYLLAEFKCGFDATTIEGELQRYMENELNLPHGKCLHRIAGMGSIKQNSEDTGEVPHYVGITFMKISDPIFGDISDPGKNPPLTSFTTTSHDGKKTVRRVVVQNKNEPFPETKSVLKDKAEIVRINAAASKKRRLNRAEEKTKKPNLGKEERDGPYFMEVDSSDDNYDDWSNEGGSCGGGWRELYVGSSSKTPH